MPDQYRRNPEDDRRDDRRGFPERAGDEVRSWFGDDEARARRGNDERGDRYPYGGERDRSWQEQGGGGSSRDQRPWRGDDRGYGGERGGQQQSGQYGQGGQYGSSSHDRGSYGRGDDRDWERRGDDRSWSRGRDWQPGRSERSGAASDGDPRWNQGREPEGGGRSAFGGYDPGGYGSGRYESGGYGGGRGASGHGESGYGSGGYGGGESRGGFGGGPYGGGAGYSGGAGSWGRDSYSGRGPKDYKRSDDRIREEISDRLTDDHHVDATEIAVQVQNGEVTLSGSVPSRDQKRRAEDLAESISGVREVTNSLRVNRQGQSQSLETPLGLSNTATHDVSGTSAQDTSQTATSASSKGSRSNTT